MGLLEWARARGAVELGLWFSQHSPRWAGYGVSRLFADAVAYLKPVVYQTVRKNLAQVLGADADETTLRSVVHHIFDHAGRTYYDFFRAIGEPQSVLANSVRISPDLVQFIRTETGSGRGVLLLGAHMSNFDLGLLALGARGLPSLILSLGEPDDGFGLLNDLRQMDGVEVASVSAGALRAAIERLKGGGMVITGADRPVAEERSLVPFFGRPSRLPLGPARLALMTSATVLLGVCYHDEHNGYVLDVSGPIEMVRSGNRRRDMLDSTRRLAEVMERYIRARPEQWMMFHPMWDEDNDEGAGNDG
jgi:KDO2-lipid IV(A) lauroyltransferase